MGKIVGVFALAVILAGCGNRSDDNILVIGDRFFVQQVHDIFLNTSQFLGWTIQYEGIFRIIHWSHGDDFHVVMRYTISCCGEVPIGFFILLPDSLSLFPPDHAWVKLTGVLEEYNDFLVIRATSLIEMEERGSDFVH